MQYDWMELVKQLFEIVIFPLLGVATTFLIKYLNAKSSQIKEGTDNVLYKKYIDMLTDTITRCVIATNQTYVDALKKEGKFDAEAQKKAFELTYDAVLGILSQDTIDYLNNAVSDLDAYITNLIESEVNKNKTIPEPLPTLPIDNEQAPAE